MVYGITPPTSPEKEITLTVMDPSRLTNIYMSIPTNVITTSMLLFVFCL